MQALPIWWFVGSVVADLVVVFVAGIVILAFWLSNLVRNTFLVSISWSDG